MFYQLLEFKADPAFIGKLEIEFRRDERIIRFITVKLEKYAAEYAEKRRKKVNAKTQSENMIKIITTCSTKCHIIK